MARSRQSQIPPSKKMLESIEAYRREYFERYGKWIKKPRKLETMAQAGKYIGDLREALGKPRSGERLTRAEQMSFNFKEAYSCKNREKTIEVSVDGMDITIDDANRPDGNPWPYVRHRDGKKIVGIRAGTDWEDRVLLGFLKDFVRGIFDKQKKARGVEELERIVEIINSHLRFLNGTERICDAIQVYATGDIDFMTRCGVRRTEIASDCVVKWSGSRMATCIYDPSEVSKDKALRFLKDSVVENQKYAILGDAATYMRLMNMLSVLDMHIVEEEKPWDSLPMDLYDFTAQMLGISRHEAKGFYLKAMYNTGEQWIESENGRMYPASVFQNILKDEKRKEQREFFIKLAKDFLEEFEVTRVVEGIPREAYPRVVDPKDIVRWIKARLRGDE